MASKVEVGRTIGVVPLNGHGRTGFGERGLGRGVWGAGRMVYRISCGDRDCLRVLISLPQGVSRSPDPRRSPIGERVGSMNGSTLATLRAIMVVFQ